MGPTSRMWGFFSSPLGDNVLGVGVGCRPHEVRVVSALQERAWDLPILLVDEFDVAIEPVNVR